MVICEFCIFDQSLLELDVEMLVGIDQSKFEVLIQVSQSRFDSKKISNHPLIGVSVLEERLLVICFFEQAN